MILNCRTGNVLRSTWCECDGWYHRRKLEGQVSELLGKVHNLEEELEKHLQEMDDEREAHSMQKLALERENDLLREQLKKYVSIVQAQRQESPPTMSNSDATSSGKLVALINSYCHSMSIDLPATSSAPKDNTATENSITTDDKKLQEVSTALEEGEDILGGCVCVCVGILGLEKTMLGMILSTVMFQL